MKKKAFNIKDIPLQQRKKARTRLALLDATIELMKKKPFADITVDAICREAEVSKGTFFRYFPRKKDLILFQVRLWNIEALWYARHATGQKSGLGVIEAYFRRTARIITAHPRFFSEVIAYRAFAPLELTRRYGDTISLVSPVERLIRFPDLEGVESIREGTFRIVFQESLEEAVANGELASEIDLQEVVLSLTCLFYGVPIMIADQTPPPDLAAAYQKQLHILWAGLRATDWNREIFRQGGE